MCIILAKRTGKAYIIRQQMTRSYLRNELWSRYAILMNVFPVREMCASASGGLPICFTFASTSHGSYGRSPCFISVNHRKLHRIANWCRPLHFLSSYRDLPDYGSDFFMILYACIYWSNPYTNRQRTCIGFYYADYADTAKFDYNIRAVVSRVRGCSREPE